MVGGKSYIVPVLYRWAVRPLVALAKGVEVDIAGGGRILESDKLRVVDFGESVGFFFPGIRPFCDAVAAGLYN